MRCKLETNLDLKIHYAKSKHYSCHMNEDLQKEQFCCSSYYIKCLTGEI